MQEGTPAVDDGSPAGATNAAASMDTEAADPGAPNSEDDEASEDELLDEGDDPDPLGDVGALGLCWWKTIPFDAILARECGTASLVPEGVEHAVATLRPARGPHPQSTSRE